MLWKALISERFLISYTSKTLRYMSFKYPPVHRDESISDNYFGTTVKDPYRWLEDPDSKETKKFVADQNEITRPYLDSCTYRERIKNNLTKIWNFPKHSVPFRHGNKYYQSRNSGLQNQSVIYVLNTLEDEGEVFLDPNLLSADGTIALSGTTFSEDGKTFAYGLSANGSDWLEIKFKDADSKKDYPETLKKVKFSSMSWMHDNIGFFYAAYLDQEGRSDGSETESQKNQKLYYHKLGTEQSEDFVVVEFEDPQWMISGEVSDCGQYLVVTVSKGCKNRLLYFFKFDNKRVTEKFKLTPVETEFVAEYSYITNNDNIFFFHTNKNAPNYRIIKIDFDNPVQSEWKELLPEHPKDVINWASVINTDVLVICWLNDVKHKLRLYNLNDGQKTHEFDLDAGTIASFSGKRKHTEMFFNFSSFLTPNIIYRVEFTESGTIEESKFYETKISDFDAEKYQTTQIFFPTKDNVNIPMYIVSKKNLKLDGQNPCILYGYGGFNINIMPTFAISRIVFMNNFNGIYAIANIRGGGEYGDKWHDGGRLSKKQNCFDDFQTAAKYLIENKYTNPKLLTIQGGSNGGLLVAACFNQAPQLFGAVICQVGVLDMLRFHKFTIGYAWKTDYGSSEEPDQFKYLYEYSPLHNIRPEKDVNFPAMLLLTADHDDRVVPLHSFKFIAELQNTIGSQESQKNPLMIRIDTKAGHGMGKPTAKQIEEVTDIFCFLSNALGLKYID